MAVVAQTNAEMSFDLDITPPSLAIVERSAFEESTFEGVLLENYIQSGFKLTDKKPGCGYDVVTLVVPKKAWEFLTTIAAGGDVACDPFLQHIGIMTLENIFVWSRMWNDRRFLMTISKTLLHKCLLINSSQINAHTVQYLDPIHNTHIMARGGEFLRYIQKTCDCKNAGSDGGNGSEDDCRGDGEHSGRECTCEREGFVVPVDYAVKMVVIVDNEYMVFVRLTTATDSSSPQTINPFGNTDHSYEYHGSRMQYLGTEPLRFIPIN